MKKYKITSADGTSVISNNIRDGIACAADLGRINNLIADEEAAISAYDLAISQSQNETCKKLFKHIKDEEVEHLEELRALKKKIESGSIEDSIVDSKKVFHITYKYKQDYKNAKEEESTDDIEAEDAKKAEELLDAKLDRNNKVLVKVVSIKEK